MKRCWILTPKEKEFIVDWLKVVNGETTPEEFYEKWSTKKGGETVFDDYEKVVEGEMTIEEFRKKWSAKADWKNNIRAIRSRLEKKRRNLNKIKKEIVEEIALLTKFFSLDKLP